MRTKPKVYLLSPSNLKKYPFIWSLMKKNGPSFPDLAWLSGNSVSGMAGLRSKTSISLKMATAISKTYGFEDWNGFITEGTCKKSNKSSRAQCFSDWQASVEFRLASLEKELMGLRKLMAGH